MDLIILLGRFVLHVKSVTDDILIFFFLLQSLTDKLAGYKEELHGKIARKPQLVKEGRDKVSGEAKRRQRLGLDVCFNYILPSSKDEISLLSVQEESPFAQQQPQSPKLETGDSPNGPEKESTEVKSTASSKGEEKGTAAPEIDM